MKQLIFWCFAIITLSFFACKKESTPFTFTEKPYQPESVETIKAKVATFVSRTTSLTSERDPFPNTEVNEAKWDMEAAANFLYNDNLGENVITETQTFAITIPNVIEGNVLKMVGSEMTAKFQEMVDQIEAVEAQTGKVGVMADLKFEQVTASASEVSIVVAFAEEQEVAGVSFESAARMATHAINVSMPAPACIQWNPSISIHSYVQGGINSPQPPWDTRVIIESGTGLFILPGMNFYQGLEINYPYPASWLSNDIDAAYSVAQYRVAIYNASHANEPTKFLRKVLVRSAIWMYPSGFEKSLYVSSIIAAEGVFTVCYEE
jgi:hypothetical protein